MDFYKIFDENMDNNDQQESNPSISNSAEDSIPLSVPTPEVSAKNNEGAPVRWDFKAILKQEVESSQKKQVGNSNESVVSSEVAPINNETSIESTVQMSEEVNIVNSGQTGDSDFDREWAEMLAREDSEKQARFIAENQISTVPEIVVEASAPAKIPTIRSVAEIMKGFGNPGADDAEDDSFEENKKESFIPAKSSVTSFVAEVPLASIVEIPAEPVLENSPTVVSEENAELVVEATIETPVEAPLEIIAAETVEIVAEVTPEIPAELTPEIVAEVIPEVIAELATETIAEVQFESFVEPVATTEEVSVTELAMTDEFTNEESIVEELSFEPIQLAGENNEAEQMVTTPVFVNVEHAWMYADEPTESIGEAITDEDFQSSLPGELPLFSSDESSEIITMQTDTHTHNNLKSEEAMKFELPEYSSIIKVIGVGGGGSNAVNHMYKFGIKGVDFLVCNTDKQALDQSPVPHKIVLGATLTEGRGAGSIPEVGRNAAIENIEDLRQVLAHNTKMVFITAGMGGGTGTGAAPVIAGVARELGILTVGIVTVPFSHEGKKRRQYAEEGIELLKQNVDTLLVIRNDKLREMYGNLKLSDAFAHADDVLTTAAKSIAEIISLTQQINVDFADICTVMRNSGVAIMGSAVASGENRAVRAVEMSLNSPLLNDNNIIGARYVLLNIISGSDEITMDELGEITDFIQEAAGQTAEIIKGYGVDPSLGESVSVTIIATGFQQTSPVNHEYISKAQPEKVVLHLNEQKASVEPKAEVESNSLEPFLVSKTTEPVTETKEEWTSTNVVEFEIVNTSQEVIEPVSQATDSNDSAFGDAINTIEEALTEENLEPVLIVKEETKSVEVDPIEAAKKAEQEEIQRRANERIQKLRDISVKLKSPQVLNDLENEPAYKRRNVSLDNVPHSSESQVSRFTLTETDEKKIEIRPNNSFLHDNVD